MLRKDVDKVVIIAHGLGVLKCSLIIDRLVNDVPQDYLERIEVYTFGNVANHFGNQLVCAEGLNGPVDSAPERMLGHVEHYANQGDILARFGVLNAVDKGNAFLGPVFRIPQDGHFLNQHYLAQCLPLDGPGPGAFVSEQCAKIMNMAVIADDRQGASTGSSASAKMRDVIRVSGLSGTQVELISSIHLEEEKLKMKDFSRLWQYRDGRRPEFGDPRWRRFFAKGKMPT